MPGYLAIFSESEDDIKTRLFGSVQFTLGFSLVFISLAAIATNVGSFFSRNSESLSRVSGLIIIFFGLMLMIPSLNNKYFYSSNYIDIKNFNRYIRQRSMDIKDVRGAICHAAMILSNDLEVNGIVIMTETGITAMKMARYRPKAMIYALCTSKKVYFRLSLIWGIVPILVKPYDTTEKMINEIGKLLKEKKYLKAGELFIITAGVSAGVSGSTDMLKIHSVN